jgi:hypothetical protein
MRYVFETGSETFRQTFRNELFATIASVDAEPLASKQESQTLVNFAVKLNTVLAMLREELEQPNGET